MEGAWRGFSRAVAAVAMIAGSCFGAVGCGGQDADATADTRGVVSTANPERTFAPLIQLAVEEPYRPMSARWFIERATFWFAEDGDCADRKIAVGRTLPEQQNATIDWIYASGLGRGPAYWRNPYRPDCTNDFGNRSDANELTRPHDPSPMRLRGLRPGQGYYLDLVDAHRGGPAYRGGLPTAPVYVERRDEGDSRVRLTYWMLFGMNAPPAQPDEAHEGDWERVDVLLRDEGERRYLPETLQVSGQTASPGEEGSTSPRNVDIDWQHLERIEGTHPVVSAAYGSHAMEAGLANDLCDRCPPWRTWKMLMDARRQLWYGFGGAWGQLGGTEATTGPLGPHRHWPTPDDGRSDDL